MRYIARRGNSGSNGGSRGNSGGNYSGNSGRYNSGSGNYNSSGYGNGQNMSRSENARRSYMETKEMHRDNSEESKQARTKELERYMRELSGDVTDMITDATPEERQMLKQKMTTLVNKL